MSALVEKPVVSIRVGIRKFVVFTVLSGIGITRYGNRLQGFSAEKSTISNKGDAIGNKNVG